MLDDTFNGWNTKADGTGTPCAADQEYVRMNPDKIAQLPDLKDPQQWYYYDMVEATSEHGFTMTGGTETWKQ